MSWSIIEQSQTGEVQYIIASWEGLPIHNPANPGVTVNFTDNFNVSGYTKGTISGVGAGATAEMKVEGSNDGTNFFDLSPSIVTGLSGIVTWSVPVKFVRVTAIAAAASISTILLMAAAGGSGNLSAGGGGGGSAYAAGSDKEIQFNDGGFFGGASGALYDKTANTNTGQVQLADGSVSEPTLAFTNSTGTFPGTFGTGIYRTPGTPGPFPEPNSLDFSVDGQVIMRLALDGSLGEMACPGGDDIIPGINFGTSTQGIGEDYGTGFYHKLNTATTSAIGFCCDGGQVDTEIVSMHYDNTLPAGNTFINGLNVGLPTPSFDSTIGIRRLSTTFTNSWEDGNCGNSEFIVFTATDFMSFSNTTTRNATFVTYSTADASRSPVVYNNAAVGPALACKLIPKGFIIDNGDDVRCFIYSDIATGLVPQAMDVEVRVQIAAGPTVEAAVGPIAAATIPAGGMGWQTAGDGSVNRAVINIPTFGGAFTAAGTGTGFNTVNVLVTPTAQMSDSTGGIVAFKVPIKRV